MPVPDSNLSTLQNIRNKVRLITRSPAEAQLTTAQLDNYINTFILYDFPESVRLFPLRTTLTFYTQPNVDVYQSTDTNVNDPLFNFKNRYIAIHPPLFIAGVECFYTQNREIFYGYYPQTNTVSNTTAIASGAAGPYSFTLSAVPVLQNNVVISTPDVTGTQMVLVDLPINSQSGFMVLPNSVAPLGAINYVTGAVTVTFPNPTVAGTPIASSTIPYQTGKTQAMLYYDYQFTLRPVPDKVYTVQFEADIRPTELLNSADVPQLSQWWQYIALGCARLVFVDRMDWESVNLIMDEYNRQESFVLRETLTQQANERTATIYTQGKNYGFGWFGPGGWPY